MGNTTEIAWCDKTWSPWTGCSKVSAGCANCYAEEMMDKRFGLAVWGPNGTRTKTKDWSKPLAWNRQAARTGKRFKVFLSICDPFEDRPELVPWRSEFFGLIARTPHFDWLLLTKRPENVNRMIPGGIPQNVWLGTSVENQETANERITWLLKCQARVRFLSCEPLLAPLDLELDELCCTECFSTDVRSVDDWGYERKCFNCGEGFADATECTTRGQHLHWVIVGGESGPNARPMHPQWARSIRDQCAAAGVPFFFKQWGEWVTEDQSPEDIVLPSRSLLPWVENDDEGDFIGDHTSVYRVGKRAAGRLLDGREWNEFPEVEYR